MDTEYEASIPRLTILLITTVVLPILNCERKPGRESWQFENVVRPPLLLHYNTPETLKGTK
jgi:hypothetical protein